jgi:hypothetical protein
MDKQDFLWKQRNSKGNRVSDQRVVRATHDALEEHRLETLSSCEIEHDGKGILYCPTLSLGLLKARARGFDPDNGTSRVEFHSAIRPEV